MKINTDATLNPAMNLAENLAAGANTVEEQARILMCAPDFYGIEYEINAWMRRDQPADKQLAQRQWQDLRRILEDVGANVELIPAQAGLPDMVFTANAGLIYRNRVVISRFRPKQRRGEEPHFAAWFADKGYLVQELPDGMYFEGAGDALYCGDTLVAGYRTRSTATSQQYLGELLRCQVIPLELVDPYFYHLDTCFCPLEPGVALWFPGAFDEYGQRALARAVPDLIEIPVQEAREFAANAVVVGRTVVTNVGCPTVHGCLQQRGYTPVATPLGEFVKAGGSAKCLTLRLDGEEAASWKRPDQLNALSSAKPTRTTTSKSSSCS